MAGLKEPIVPEEATTGCFCAGPRIGTTNLHIRSEQLPSQYCRLDHRASFQQQPEKQRPVSRKGGPGFRLKSAATSIRRTGRQWQPGPVKKVSEQNSARW